MKVLITGAAGFIGSSVAEAMLRRGDHVIGVDNFDDYYDPRTKLENIREIEATAASSGGRFELIRADILDPDGAIHARLADPKGRPDAILHLAALAGVRPSIQRPVRYHRVNVEGTVYLLEEAAAAGSIPFVFASSSSVYGARREVPFREDDRVDDPVSPYAASKKAGELVGYTYHHLYGMSFTALRFFTVYGPRQRPDMAIHLFARNILEGRPIRVHGDGTSRRDYTYIDDCVAGVVAAVDHAVASPGYRIFNLGRSETTSLDELVSLIAEAAGVPARIERVADQPGDVPITYADIERARKALGYDPRTPVRAGVPRFVEWLKARASR